MTPVVVAGQVLPGDRRPPLRADPAVRGALGLAPAASGRRGLGRVDGAPAGEHGAERTLGAVGDPRSSPSPRPAGPGATPGRSGPGGGPAGGFPPPPPTPGEARRRPAPGPGPRPCRPAPAAGGIGVILSPASDNSCANQHAAARANGKITHGKGAATGNLAGLPPDSPLNQCRGAQASSNDLISANSTPHRPSPTDHHSTTTAAPQAGARPEHRRAAGTPHRQAK